MSKILVTGATGNVGKYVTEYLLEQDTADLILESRRPLKTRCRMWIAFL